MKTKFFTFLLALLFTAIGGANAAGTYTVRVTDDYTLSTSDLQAITVLVTQNVISLTTSGNLRIVKNSSGTTLFNIDWDTRTCYLSSSTSSANNLMSSITLSSSTLLSLAPNMLNYTSIAMTFPDPEAYAARLNNKLTFYYDHQRSVHTTTYSLNTGSNNPGWYSISGSITSVEFNQTFANARPTSCYRWFAGMTNITNITGQNYLNTSNVTNMSYMFDGSTGFSSLDLSTLNTANVTNMEAMFRNCSGLSGLYVSSLNTGNVTNMKEMFKNCTGIVNLDLTNLNVANVTTTTGILQGCSGLKSLNLSAALLNKIEDGGCTGIGTTTSPCALYYPTTSHPTFSEATYVYVKWKGGYFNSANRRTYAYMNGTTLTFCYDDYYDSRKASLTVYDLSSGSNNPSWYSNRTNIRSVTFNSSFANARPLTCYKWFCEMSNLTSISGLTNLNTSSVTNMYGMFSLCQQLTSLNVSSFNTSNVTNMESMFGGLSQITSLNVSNFNTAKVTNMQNMFKNCSQLTSLNLSNFTITSSTNTSGMLNNMIGLQTLTLSTSLVNYLNSTACTHIGTDIYGTLTTPCTLIYPANLHLSFTEVGPNYVKWKDGYFTDPNMKPYACLSGNTLTFYYDDNYASRQATSTVYDLTTSNRPGWYNSRQNITSVVFNSSFANARPTTCESWFEGMNNLTTITGLSYLNTSNVTNMNGMFNGCSRLTSLNLNLSTFNTSNVTDMASMFYGCSGLTSLNVSNFNTAKVTDMYRMFYGCSGLTSLNASNFNTTNVTDFQEMFYGCSGLKSLDVSNFVTNVNADWVRGFVSGCTALESLSLSASLTSRIEANGCTGIGTDTAPCTLIYPTSVYLQLYDVTPTYFRWKGGYFTSSNVKPYACLHGKFLNFYYDDQYVTSQANSTVYDLNTGLDDPDWISNAESITEVAFDYSFRNARPTSCQAWFALMKNLTSITGLNYLNTSEVTNMAYMFMDCIRLTDLDLSQLNTSKVTTMEGMFFGCTPLLNLNISSFNTENLTNMSYMFYTCSGLESLDLSNFNAENVTNTESMFFYCSGLESLNLSATLATNMNNNACEGVGTAESPCLLIYPSDVELTFTEVTPDYVKWKNGYFLTNTNLVKAYAVFNGNTLTFYYDDASSSKSGTVYELNTGDNDPDWRSNAESITEVVFDASFSDARPTSCQSWFAMMKNLTSITGLNNLNTSEVTTMAYMFLNCSGFDDLDLSQLNTSNVANMEGMFWNCTQLTQLNISSFNTENVTNMSQMFYECRGLEILDLSNFNTANVESMYAMFFHCLSLTSLDVSNFNTANVRLMSAMFNSCSSLTSLNVSNFQTDNITDTMDTEGMFYNCSGMKSLSLSAALIDIIHPNACSGVGTAESPCALIYPSDMELTFTEVTPNYVKWKDGYFLPSVKAYAVLDGNTLTFYYDNTSYAKSGTVYELNTGENNPKWVLNTDIRKVVFDDSFSDARPTSCYRWFSGSRYLTSITGLNNLNTSEVTNMANMFMDCIRLTDLDLSNFNTSKVTNMEAMFLGSSQLTNLNISSFNTENVTNMFSMFFMCSGLTSLDLSNFNTANISDMSYMFYYCSNLTSLDVSSFNTANVTTMEGMFSYCSNLTSLDVSNFNTANVSNMSSMFDNCSSLTSLDLSNFQTNNITDALSTVSLFYNCSRLKSLNLSATLATNMDSNACSGVGTTESPCVLIYPEDCSIEKEEIGDGWFRWSAGYFTEAPAFLMGDVNSDDKVTIADVTALVNIILGKDSAGLYNRDAADVNGDHQVTIADVTALVNLILGK